MDKTLDMRILGTLLKDARASYRTVAKKLGTSVATVASRVRHLEKQGIITGYNAVVDYEKLGFLFNVIIEVKVAHGKLFDVEKKIANDPHVFAVLDHTGGTDTTVLARFRDRKSLDEFIKKLQSVKFVERTETKLILNIIKNEQTQLPIQDSE